MVNLYSPSADQRNFQRSTMGCPAQVGPFSDQAGPFPDQAGLGNVGFTWPESLTPNWDQQTMLYVGGGLAAVLVLSMLLGGGRRAKSSATARAKAAYAKEYADLTGRMPRSL